ncbi:unnamed protein product [Sphagnum balticum]
MDCSIDFLSLMFRRAQPGVSVGSIGLEVRWSMRHCTPKSCALEPVPLLQVLPLGVKQSFETRWIGWAGVNVHDEKGRMSLTESLASKTFLASDLEAQQILRLNGHILVADQIRKASRSTLVSKLVKHSQVSKQPGETMTHGSNALANSMAFGGFALQSQHGKAEKAVQLLSEGDRNDGDAPQPPMPQAPPPMTTQDAMEATALKN